MAVVQPEVLITQALYQLEGNFKGYTPEVVIAHVLQQIDTRFQRLYQGFRVAQLDGLITDIR